MIRRHTIGLKAALGMLAMMIGMSLAVSPAEAASGTITVRLSANAAGIRFWNTVSCTNATISTSVGVLRGTITQNWFNGCSVEFRNVPRGTVFAFRVDGQIRDGGVRTVSTGALATATPPRPNLWGVVDLGSFTLR